MASTAPVARLLTVAEVAGQLALSRDTVERLCDRGHLVVYRLGRAVRVDPASVEAYLARCRLHVPQSVPTSAAPISSAVVVSGTRTADPSGEGANRSTPKTTRRPRAGSAPSSPAPANDVTPSRAERLLAKKLSQPV